MSTILKLLEECENIYYKLQESNDTTFFRFKLVHSIYNTLYNTIYRRARNDNPHKIPELTVLIYYLTHCALTKENIISKTTTSETQFILFNKDKKPLTIKFTNNAYLKEELIPRFVKTTKDDIDRDYITKNYKNISQPILYYSKSIQLDINNNILYLDRYNYNYRKLPQHPNLVTIITLLDSEITEDINVELADFLDIVKKIDDEIPTNVFKQTTKLIEGFKNNLKLTRIKENITKIYQDRYSNRLLTLDNNLTHLINEYRNTLKEKETIQASLYFSNSTYSESITKFIDNLELFKEKKYIVDYSYILNSNRILIEIYWNILPIIYYNEETLEKSYKNITTLPELQECIQKVLKGEYSIYTAPLKTKLYISSDDNNNLAFFQTYPIQSPIGYENRHTTFQGGNGCRGSFALPMEDALNSFDLSKLLYLIKQFYQSATVGDPLGNEIFKYGTYVNNETGEIIYDKNRDVLIGQNIENIKKSHYERVNEYAN